MTWLQRIVAIYAAVFTGYVVIRVAADAVRAHFARRRFKAQTVAMLAEADAILAGESLRRMVEGQP